MIEDDKICKGCRVYTPTPHFQHRHGYCLSCRNVGLPEKDAKIAELTESVKKLKRALERIRHIPNIRIGYTVGDKADDAFRAGLEYCADVASVALAKHRSE